MLRRLTLAVVPAASLGLLAWLPFMYLALTRGRRRDHVVLTVMFTLSVAEVLAMISVSGGDSRSALVGVGMIFYSASAAAFAWGALAPERAWVW